MPSVLCLSNSVHKRVGAALKVGCALCTVTNLVVSSFFFALAFRALGLSPKGASVGSKTRVPARAQLTQRKKCWIKVSETVFGSRELSHLKSESIRQLESAELL